MEKYIANSHALPSVLICCWEKTRNRDIGILFAHLIASMPRSILERMALFPKEAGRSKTLEFDKFARWYEKRGAKDLESLAGIAFRGSADFDVQFHCSCETQKLSVYGINEFWKTVNTPTYVQRLLAAFPVFYGQLSRVAIATYQPTGRQIEYPLFDENAALFGMIRYYQEAYRRWCHRHQVSTRTSDEMRFLNFVYTYNILSAVHLNATVPSDGCTLSEWIRRKPHRGTLQAVTESNAIWHVAPEDREAVVRTLWRTGLFPVSCHFKIVKWDSHNNLPWLAAHKSALEFLVDPGQDLVLARHARYSRDSAAVDAARIAESTRDGGDESVDDETSDATPVCMRCGGDIAWEIAMDPKAMCPHCGRPPSMMGFELLENPDQARADLVREVEFIRSTPPSCIKDLAARRLSIADSDYDATVEWGISCKCGCPEGKVFGYVVRGKGLVRHSPLSFACRECSRESVFFDESIHGYNRAFDDEDGSPSRPQRPTGRKTGISCPKCSRRILAVRLLFSNPAGSGVDLEDEPEYADRCQDFFDYITCRGVCSSCGHTWVFAEFECA
jgi:DNA-directed RNA polymerase subunit RPC12/RpoP